MIRAGKAQREVLRLVCLLALVVLLARTALAECLSPTKARLGLASLLLVGEVAGSVETKDGGRDVTVRVVEYLRGPGPKSITYHEPALSRCPAKAFEPAKTYVFLLAEHPAHGLVPVSYEGPGHAWSWPASFALCAEKLMGWAPEGEAPTLDELRSVLAGLEPRVRYRPAAPTAGDEVVATVSVMTGCGIVSSKKRKGPKIFTTARVKRKKCTGLGFGLHHEISLGRLTSGRYVHFHNGAWIGYLVVREEGDKPK